MPPTPNRYGRDGYLFEGNMCCRHSVALYRNCDECAKLLSYILHPEKRPASARGDPPELPTLIGTGDIVDLEPKP